MLLIQHEVIIYAEDEKAAKRSLLSNTFMKGRTNLQCTYITEIPLPEHEDARNVIDERKAPGS
jgi:hypothetical protein